MSQSIGGSIVVPKGPSLNPKDKRLAILTDDHPLSYKNFEGVIPKGEYGAGAVIVWDRGKYKNIKTNKQRKSLTMKKAFSLGTIEVIFKGNKLKGAFALIRMRDKNWLLIKMNDEYADRCKNIAISEPYSVKSGRTIHEL